MPRNFAGLIARLGFRAKITLGFSVLLSLTAVLVAASYWGFQLISGVTEEYQSVVEQAEAARQIDRELGLYQPRAYLYALNGRVEDLSSVLTVQEQLGAAIKRAELITTGKTNKTLVSLEAKYDTCARLFSEILAARAANNSILAVRIRAVFEAAGEKLTGMSQATTRDETVFKIDELRGQLEGAKALIENYIFRPEETLKKKIPERFQASKDALRVLADTDSSSKEGLISIEHSVDGIAAAFADLTSGSDAVQEKLERFGQSIRDAVDDAKEIKEGLINSQNALSAKVSAAARDTKKSVLGLGGAIVLLGTILALGLSVGISRPMVKLCTAMRRLASGQDEIELPGLGRRDEVGQLAAAVEQFKILAAENAKQEAAERDAQHRASSEQRRSDLFSFAERFEQSVGGIVTLVKQSSADLEVAASSLTNTAETTQALSGRANAASEATSANVQSIASATEELSMSFREIERQIHETSRMAKEAVTEVEVADRKIVTLSNAARRIGEVLELITAIAGQTNLLALNATIEAARAGETGRGFSVVASEVKSLAGQTARATAEISSHITGIRDATEGSVDAIKKISAAVARVSSLSASISTSVVEQTTATDEIARNVQMVARGTRDFADEIVEVDRRAGETGTSSEQVLKAARQLAEQATDLRGELDSFMQSVRAA
jgi:methyl-accepting chemotaxis protein